MKSGIAFADVQKVVIAQPVHDQASRRAKRFGLGSRIHSAKIRLELLGYLLGILIGDAAKRKTSRRSKMFIELQLTKRHYDNCRLGEYVGLCGNVVGLRFSRIGDNYKDARSPYGRFHWKSESSEFVYWLFTICLGLEPGQLTTWDPVKMDWILQAPRYFRLGFLQGLADSDGYVHFEKFEVHLIASPNANLIATVLASLGVGYTAEVSKGLDILKLKINDAFDLSIFNPRVGTYRYRLVQRLAHARRLRRGPWPNWLASKVDKLASRNLTTREIMTLVLNRYNLFIRAPNVRRHARMIRLTVPSANKGINWQPKRRMLGP